MSSKTTKKIVMYSQITKILSINNYKNGSAPLNFFQVSLEPAQLKIIMSYAKRR